MCVDMCVDMYLRHVLRHVCRDGFGRALPSAAACRLAFSASSSSYVGAPATLCIAMRIAMRMAMCIAMRIAM